MQKEVNGQLIEVDTRMFELALEGEQMRAKALSSVKEGIKNAENMVQAKSLIERYNKFICGLQYPLCSIERDIKYAAIGTYLKRYKDLKQLKMIVENGLSIILDEETGEALHCCGDTWSITYVNEIKDNCDMSKYEHEEGYAEFKWVLGRKSTKESYFDKFMPEFVEACGNDKHIMEWEVWNILKFSEYPEKSKEIPKNKIIDVARNRELSIEIFADSKESALRGGKKVYNYQGFELVKSGEDFKHAKIRLAGLDALFMKMLENSGGTFEDGIPSYRSVILGNEMIFEVEKHIYKCRYNRDSEIEEISNNSEMYMFNENSVFVERTTSMGNGVEKHMIYELQIKKETPRICEVWFTH